MLAVAAAALALSHASVTTAPAAGDLAAQVRASRTPWIGYSVPAVDGYRTTCDRCRLADDNVSFSRNDDDEIHPVAGNIAVFYRIENGAIESVRAYPLDCPLDGGGASVTWLDGVDSRQSVALLASLVGGDRAVSHRAMAALALHAAPSAGDRLEGWAQSSSASDEVRGQALFWLAETRPQRGLDAARAVSRDAAVSRRLREKAIFALSQIRMPAATDELIHIARNDGDSHVRGQALFWLAQQAGKKAAGALRDAIDTDADEHVRERAVFAVSQLPDDESIPLLVDLLKHHRDPNVRKKAAFWLGQKHDPRALNALEEILLK